MSTHLSKLHSDTAIKGHVLSANAQSSVGYFERCDLIVTRCLAHFEEDVQICNDGGTVDENIKYLEGGREGGREREGGGGRGRG